MIALVRRLMTGTSRPWLRLAGSVLLSAAASLCSVALMGVAAWLLSRAAEHPPVMYLTAAAVGVRAFGIGRGTFRYLDRLVSHDLGLRLQSALRLDTYAALARTTLLGRRRGDLLTRVVADVDAILDLVVRVAVPFAAGGLVVLATTGVLAVFSPPAAAAVLTTALAGGVGAPVLASRLSARADAAAIGARGRLADLVHEVGRTAPDLVAYGADLAWLERVARADAELRAVDDRAAWVRGLAGGAQQLAAGVACVSGFALGAAAHLDGRLDRTMIAVLALTPLALHEVFGDFTKAAQTWTRARVSLGRVTELLDAEPVGVGDLTPGPLVERPFLEVDDVAIGWPGHPVLAEHLDLRAGPGEKVAVVGPSGAGKTTLAATVLGLIPPREGRITVHGRVGYLAQDAHVFSTTVAENVRIGRRSADDDEVADALARARLDVAPDRLVGELGASLSGGETRRLALSRLLVGDNQVVVLDEPTEHLDAATADALIEDLWATTADRPVLVLTHDPALLARCDRLVRIGGPVVPCGQPQRGAP